MKALGRWLLLLLVLWLLAGCVPNKADLIPTARPVTPTTSSPSPTTSPLSTLSPLPTSSPVAQPCEMIITKAVQAYAVPRAETFATLDAGMRFPVAARTEDGWLGFEPGIAQAAAVGPFRLRWVPADAVRLEGDCADLPVITPPPLDRCYEMAMTDIPLRAAPAPDAAVVATLPVEDYAVILGLSPDGLWLKLELRDGTQGWMDAMMMNITGACESLPTLQP